MVLANEEKVIDETASYYRAIALLIKTHEKIMNDEGEEQGEANDELNQSMRSKNE
jgi:hypothetical protein